MFVNTKLQTMANISSGPTLLFHHNDSIKIPFLVLFCFASSPVSTGSFSSGFTLSADKRPEPSETLDPAFILALLCVAASKKSASLPVDPLLRRLRTGWKETRPNKTEIVIINYKSFIII